MHKIDFLSEPPVLFIFEQKANKNICGAIFTIIIAVIMAFISAAYIYEYKISEKYTYEAIKFQNFSSNKEEMTKILAEEKYKPNLTFDVSIEADNFTVYKQVENNFSFPEITHIDVFGRPHYIFNEISNYIGVNIVYKCGTDEKCTSFYDLIKAGKFYFGQINVEYPKKIINHTADVPIRDDNEKKAEIISGGFTNDSDYYISRFEWEVIIYKDQKSLLDSLMGNNKEYIFGHFKNDRPDKEKKNLNMNKLKIQKIGDNYYLFVTQSFFTFNQNFEYLLYRRKKLSFLNVISNISALFSTVKMVVSVIFSLYSKNFDKYEILKNILNPPKEEKKKIELKNIINKIEKIEEGGLGLGERNKSDVLIEKKENTENNSNDNERQIVPPPPINLQKFCCSSFVLNNFYSECCKIKYQEKINLINMIIQKYMSYDLLLRNQILLENLFIDYKWNNKILKYIENNQTINLLKPIFKI